MNSKEALEKLYFQCCMSNDIDDKWFEELKIIEKDLEVLRILKEYIKINDCKFNNSNKSNECIFMLIPEMEEDFKKIKDWLENE